MSRTYVIKIHFNVKGLTIKEKCFYEIKDNINVYAPGVEYVNNSIDEDTLSVEIDLPEGAEHNMIEYFKHLLNQTHMIDDSAHIEINDKYTAEKFEREYPSRGKYVWEYVYKTIHSDLSVENEGTYKFYFGDEVKYIIQTKFTGTVKAVDYYVTDCDKNITTKLDVRNAEEAIKIVEQRHLDKLIGDFNKLHDAVNNKVAELTEYSKAMAGLI